MEAKFLKLRDGCRIYIELYLNNFDKTAIFLHGGPGAGCDYFRYQAQLLSNSMNIVIFDQRGVCRSDAIQEQDNFKCMTLIEDIENIRQLLNINKCSLIGHSFGGWLALIYALKHPQNVDKIVFAGATFYGKDSSESYDTAVIEKLFALNDEKLTHELTELIFHRDKDENFSEKLRLLTPSHIVTEIFHPKPIDKEAVRVNFQHMYTDVEKEKIDVHVRCVSKDSEFAKNYMDDLKNLKPQSILITGEYDTVCSKKQREAYTKYVPNGELITMDGYGHTLHNEIPKIFVDIVSDFLNK